MNSTAAKHLTPRMPTTSRIERCVERISRRYDVVAELSLLPSRIPWIIKSGRFDILQGKKGDVITLDQGQAYPPMREQKKTTFQHTLKRRVSEVLFWVSLYKSAGSSFTPEKLFTNLFPGLDYEAARFYV